MSEKWEEQLKTIWETTKEGKVYGLSNIKEITDVFAKWDNIKQSTDIKELKNYIGMECANIGLGSIGRNNGTRNVDESIWSDIKKLLNKITENSNQDIDKIIVVNGPGSFTGIRVAMSIAKIMAGELNIPLIPLNTAQILLDAHSCDVLIMDARRDMFFFGTKEKIELIYKDKIEKLIENKKVLADKRSSEFIKNSICYEDIDKNLAQTMINLAQEKYSNSQDKNEFNYLKIEANYIQTPPVF